MEGEREKERENVSSFKYHVVINTKQIQICKKAFVSLFSISEKRVRRLQALLLQGKIPQDMQGIGNRNHALPLETLKTIHAHTVSFPVQVSHNYSRELRYLDSWLNVQKIFDLYKEKYPDSKVS
jgi:hypothetical protein